MGHQGLVHADYGLLDVGYLEMALVIWFETRNS